MPVLTGLTAALAWLGRHGTTALAVSIFLGIALPPLAAYVKPYLTEIVLVLLLFSYLRTDPAALRRYLRAPGLAILAALWIMVALPLIVGGAYTAAGLRQSWPELYTILILHMAISPITVSVAYCALLRLDVAFSLLALICSITITPLTAVAISYLFLGDALISPVDLGLRLLFVFASAAVAAWAIRRVTGQSWLDRHTEPIDGLNVISAGLFAIASMDGVIGYTIANPPLAVGLLAFVFVLGFAVLGLTMLVFLRAGARFGLVIGILSACRNLGLVMAVIGTTLPPVAWFYFALVQFPIYLFPALLRPLARRITEKR